MEENNVRTDMCTEKHNHITERFERDEERIKKQEEMGEKLSAASITLTEILRRQTLDIEDHGTRLKNIEHKPNAWLERIFTWIGSGIVMSIISFIFYTLKLKG